MWAGLIGKMFKAAEETRERADSDGEQVNYESLIDLQHESKGTAARIRDIFAEAIDAWLSGATPSSEDSAEVREARALARRYRYRLH